MKTISPVDLEKRVSGKKILIDTNIIIYLTDLVEPYVKLSRLLFEMIEKGSVTACLSVISIVEVMQGPIRKGLNEKALDVKNYLLNFPNTVCQSLDKDVLGQIGSVQSVQWEKLRTIDSIIIASGLKNRVDWFISNDTHFKKALPKSRLITFDQG